MCIIMNYISYVVNVYTVWAPAAKVQHIHVRESVCATDEHIKKACCEKCHAHPMPIMASREMYPAREWLTLTSTAVVNLNEQAAGGREFSLQA